MPISPPNQCHSSGTTPGPGSVFHLVIGGLQIRYTLYKKVSIVMPPNAKRIFECTLKLEESCFCLFVGFGTRNPENYTVHRAGILFWKHANTLL